MLGLKFYVDKNFRHHNGGLLSVVLDTDYVQGCIFEIFYHGLELSVIKEKMSMI